MNCPLQSKAQDRDCWRTIISGEIICLRFWLDNNVCSEKNSLLKHINSEAVSREIVYTFKICGK